MNFELKDLKVAKIIGWRPKLGIRFEPRDLWIGLFIDYNKKMPRLTKVYLCIVPCLPIIFTFEPVYSDPVNFDTTASVVDWLANQPDFPEN